jgi:hypothetical protein
MKLKDIIFGGGVRGAGNTPSSFRGSVQDWLPIKNIVGGVVVTRDMRIIKILEIMPINFYLKPEAERQNIIAAYAAFLKIAPNKLQAQVATQKADMNEYIARMKAYAENEENALCRAMIEDNLAEIGALGAGEAINHRFFLIFEHETQMKARRNTVRDIAARMAEEADTLRRYLNLCGLEVLEPRYSDNAVLELLYERVCKCTSRRVRLPAGVYDMTTVVHGIYETEDYHA